MSIADDTALGQWQKSLRRTFWSRDLPVVTFKLPQLSAPQNQSITSRARELRQACGCASSGFLMTMAVVCLAVAHFTSDSSSFLPTARESLVAIGCVLIAGALGKLAGILWARWRLLQLAADIRTR